MVRSLHKNVNSNYTNKEPTWQRRLDMLHYANVVASIRKCNVTRQENNKVWEHYGEINLEIRKN